MAIAVPPAGTVPERCTVEDYFALVEQGVLQPDDAVELLEGVIVAMAPQNPPHAAATSKASEALRRAIGDRGLVREEKPIVLGAFSVPEPDLCVVTRRDDHWIDSHPTTAFLVIESADWSLVQDRLTKAGIYAAAGIVEYWILNVREDRVEIHRKPDPKRRTYADRRIALRGDRLAMVAFPDVSIAVDDLLPLPQPRG